MDDIGLHCQKCGYNLTGLVRNVCPECGSTFDIKMLSHDPELRRRGTPVYGKRGWALIPRTLQTLLHMLFRPRSFAQRLRFDEPLGPAIAVFLIAISPNVWIALGCPFKSDWGWRHYLGNLLPTFFVITVMVLLILFFSGVFAVISRRQSNYWSFAHRLRYWCIVTMYSAVFLPIWPFYCAGRWLRWQDYSVGWPFLNSYCRGHIYPATIVIIWWIIIIFVVLWYRSRSRWLVVILMLAAFLFVRSMVQISDAGIPRLTR